MRVIPDSEAKEEVITVSDVIASLDKPLRAGILLVYNRERKRFAVIKPHDTDREAILEYTPGFTERPTCITLAGLDGLYNWLQEATKIGEEIYWFPNQEEMLKFLVSQTGRF